jgi:hypothetical protein
VDDTQVTYLLMEAIVVTDKNRRQSTKGGCLCGSIRYEIRGPARRTTNCHCHQCRRSSGAPFVTWLEFQPSDFRILSGTPSGYESSPQVTRQFCGKCGTQLTYQHAEDADTIDVTACSLDELDSVSPDDHVWCDRMAPWVKIADGLPRYKLGKFDT